MIASRFTCITCRVAFQDPEIQRQHYKTDWHRYNLKRKVAELPPVNAEEFQRRVLTQREQDNAQNYPVSVHCDHCRKSFNTQNAYDNHLNSKKHKELSENGEPHVEEGAVLTDVELPSTPSGCADVEESMDTDSEVEEVDSDEWDEDLENPVLNNDCLFCSHHSATMVKNVKHMTSAHSFFIPDIEYVVDLQGLLVYLGEKVFTGLMCLWCNDRGRTFYSAEAAQQHMRDKGHTKLLHEGEALAEYAEFYDYSSTYPDQTSADADQEVDDVTVLDNSDYALVLPSGTVIGHRMLMKYYKQRVHPNRALVHHKKLHRVLATYRALGWTETQQEAASKKARDIHYMRRVQSKHYAKLGIKANKLQTHYRPQVLF